MFYGKHMKSIKEVIKSMNCGRYSGKGNKYTRKRDFDSALACYLKALSYSDNEGGRALLVECIARSYARLENLDMALSEAEKCFALLNYLNSSATVLTNSKRRVACFIAALKKNDIKKIDELIAIRQRYQGRWQKAAALYAWYYRAFSK